MRKSSPRSIFPTRISEKSPQICDVRARVSENAFFRINETLLCFFRRDVVMDLLSRTLASSLNNRSAFAGWPGGGGGRNIIFVLYSTTGLRGRKRRIEKSAPNNILYSHHDGTILLNISFYIIRKPTGILLYNDVRKRRGTAMSCILTNVRHLGRRHIFPVKIYNAKIYFLPIRPHRAWHNITTIVVAPFSRVCFERLLLNGSVIVVIGQYLIVLESAHIIINYAYCCLWPEIMRQKYYAFMRSASTKTLKSTYVQLLGAEFGLFKIC